MKKEKKTRWSIKFPSTAFERIIIADSPRGFYSRHVVAQVCKRHPKAGRNAALIKESPKMLDALKRCHAEFMNLGYTKRSLRWLDDIFRKIELLEKEWECRR